jgi:carboxyl-terminal processing protease
MAYAQQTDMLKQKALILKRFLEKNHYQPLTWNDTLSIRLYNRWMELLDDEKLFFTKADIAVLEPFKMSLDEEMNAGQWQFFRKSITLYRNRLHRVDSIIKNVFSKSLDFSSNENIQFPFTAFAADDKELQQRWKKYLKWQVLRRIADDNDSAALSPADFIAAEKKAFALQKNHEEKYIKRLLGNSPEDFEKNHQENYLNSIAWSYDPHTTYMNMSVKDEFETQMSASEYSLGFDVEENDKGEPEVSFLQPGGSAWRNGELHKGDVLVAVRIGKDFKNITDLTESEIEAVFAGRDKSDTEIKVRTVTGEIKMVKLAKEKISSEEEVVKSYVLKGNSNIGYINLPGFYSRENISIQETDDISYDGCANDVSKEIVKLKKDNIAGLILDLRYNGGGSIWEAMQLAGIFIDIGPVASMKDREGKVRFLKDPNRGTIYDGPLLVLVNGASASASEFIGAVLQDYNRAIIVGGATYGKGTAQSIMPMDSARPDPNKKYDDFVKVTGEKFYRVNGGTTQWTGVVPDITLPDVYSSDNYKEKSQHSALQPDRSKAGNYTALPALPIATLKAKSDQRTSASPFFKAVSQYIQLAEKNEKSRTIPLTWSAYLRQYQENIKLYNTLSEEMLPASEQTAVINNAFDKERSALLSEYSKEVNEAYLKNIKTDPVIREAMFIMFDWTGKK